MVQPGDIYLSGGRTSRGERLIHFGTRKGALGVYLGGPLVAVLFVTGLFSSGTWLFALTTFCLLWFFYSLSQLEEPVWADHCMIAIGSGELGQTPFAQSSQRHGASIGYPNGNAPKWKLYRVPGLTEGEVAQIVGQAYALIDLHRRYRMKLNVAFGLDYIVGLGLWMPYLFRRWLVADEANVCSVFVWRVIRNAGIVGFERDPRTVSPDDLDDIGRKRWILVDEGRTT